MFDLEYLFLQLRSKSVNSIETIEIQDDQDKEKYSLKINFDDIKVNFQDNPPDNNIKVDNNITIVMKYPEASIYDSDDFQARLKKDGLFELVVRCIENIYNKDELLELTMDEKREFMDNLDIKTFRKIEEFLLSTPSVKYTVQYTNKLGTIRSLTFNSLMDFFLYL
jgi:hypothetical protein